MSSNDSYADDAYRRIVDEGHTLALHSYSHKYDEIYVSMETFKKDIPARIQHIIQRAIRNVTVGSEVTFPRFCLFA